MRMTGGGIPGKSKDFGTQSNSGYARWKDYPAERSVAWKDKTYSSVVCLDASISTSSFFHGSSNRRAHESSGTCSASWLPWWTPWGIIVLVAWVFFRERKRAAMAEGQKERYRSQIVEMTEKEAQKTVERTRNLNAAFDSKEGAAAVQRAELLEELLSREKVCAPPLPPRLLHREAIIVRYQALHPYASSSLPCQQGPSASAAPPSIPSRQVFIGGSPGR